MEYYKNAQYLEAAQEGTKIYSDLVRRKSGQETDMTNLFNTVFSADNPVLELPGFFQKLRNKTKYSKRSEISLSWPCGIFQKSDISSCKG